MFPSRRGQARKGCAVAWARLGQVRILPPIRAAPLSVFPGTVQRCSNYASGLSARHRNVSSRPASPGERVGAKAGLSIRISCSPIVQGSPGYELLSPDHMPPALSTHHHIPLTCSVIPPGIGTRNRRARPNPMAIAAGCSLMPGRTTHCGAGHRVRKVRVARRTSSSPVARTSAPCRMTCKRARPHCRRERHAPSQPAGPGVAAAQANAIQVTAGGEAAPGSTCATGYSPSWETSCCVAAFPWKFTGVRKTNACVQLVLPAVGCSSF